MNQLFSTLLNSLKTQLSEFKAIYLAYSGGLDSHVLLYLLQQINYPITAIHINHGWSHKADEWQQHCHKVCHEFNINFQAVKINVKSVATQSLEELARDARYAVFRELLQQKNSCLLTAHHQNDQAETLLLQLLRGCGVHGIAAMSQWSELNQGKLYRPLLNISRAELQEFARQEQLHWIEDESNLDCSFDRNWLRHQILPQLQQRKPGVIANLARSAALCRDATETIERAASIELLKLCDGKLRLELNALKRLSQVIQNDVIRLWLKKQGFKMPSQIKLQRISNEMIHARQDATPLVEWQGCQIRKFQNYLYAMPILTPFNGNAISWENFPAQLILPENNGFLVATCVASGGLKISEHDKIKIGFRKGGEKVTMPQRGSQHYRLKNLLQEWQVPPWLRDRIPLMYLNDHLISVVGFSKHHEPQAWQIKWIK